MGQHKLNPQPGLGIPTPALRSPHEVHGSREPQNWGPRTDHPVLGVPKKQRLQTEHPAPEKPRKWGPQMDFPELEEPQEPETPNGASGLGEP